MSSVEKAQTRLRAMVADQNDALLRRRPPNGTWSCVENVRHMVFAEQVHLGRFIPGGTEWISPELPPYTMADIRESKMVGGHGDVPIRAVLSAWQSLHGMTRVIAETDTPEIRRAIGRHLKHQQQHIHRVEVLLRGQKLGR
ncbi:MAG: DinB family protein [Dehalococcoidia bacterium]